MLFVFKISVRFAKPVAKLGKGVETILNSISIFLQLCTTSCEVSTDKTYPIILSLFLTAMKLLPGNVK